MWKNLVERRATRRNGGRRLSEAAMSRSFQAVGEWWFQNKWETKRWARSTEGRVTAVERSVEVICDAHTLGSVLFIKAELVWRRIASHGKRSSPAMVWAGTAIAIKQNERNVWEWESSEVNDNAWGIGAVCVLVILFIFYFFTYSKIRVNHFNPWTPLCCVVPKVCYTTTSTSFTPESWWFPIKIFMVFRSMFLSIKNNMNSSFELRKMTNILHRSV